MLDTLLLIGGLALILLGANGLTDGSAGAVHRFCIIGSRCQAFSYFRPRNRSHHRGFRYFRTRVGNQCTFCFKRKCRDGYR